MGNRLTRERKDAIIAAAVTFMVALLLLLLLFFKGLRYDREALAETSIPEMQDDEEIFLEPEILVVGNEGESELDEPEEAAPQPPGEPDPVEEVEQPKQVVKNLEPPKEEPVSTKPKLVAQEKTESDVKTSTPKVSAEEEQRIASMQGKFKSDNNGARNGQEGAVASTGGNGVSTSGTLKGRSMLSCPKKKVQLNAKTTVTVNVTVDANGNVTNASFKSGGGSATLRQQCVEMARGSKWTAQPGAAPATGTITFTITPQ